MSDETPGIVVGEIDLSHLPLYPARPAVDDEGVVDVPGEGPAEGEDQPEAG